MLVLCLPIPEQSSLAGKAANTWCAAATSIGGGSRTQEVVPYGQAGAAALRRAAARSESGVAATTKGDGKGDADGSRTGWPRRLRSGEPRHAAKAPATTWGGR